MTLRELLGDKYRDDMTIAEVLEATKGMNLADLSQGEYVSIGKYNALKEERDEYKQKYTQTLTEQQRAEQEALERQREYEAVMRENAIGRYQKKLGGLITDEAVLLEIATLMADGKYDEADDKKIAFIQAQTEAMRQKYESELFRQNPQEQPQNPNGVTITREQFQSMGVAERTRLYNENPTLYNQLNNN